MNMGCERQVPYAVMNYREIVREDFFFVDHTRYLRELEKYKTPVFLRPKRFGMSLFPPTSNRRGTTSTRSFGIRTGRMAAKSRS